MLDAITKALTKHHAERGTPAQDITLDDAGFALLRLLMRESLTAAFVQPGADMLLGMRIHRSDSLRPGTFLVQGQLHRWRPPTLDEMVDDAKQRLADFIDERIAHHVKCMRARSSLAIQHDTPYMETSSCAANY